MSRLFTNNAICVGPQSSESARRARLLSCRHFANGEMFDNKTQVLRDAIGSSRFPKVL